MIDKDFTNYNPEIWYFKSLKQTIAEDKESKIADERLDDNILRYDEMSSKPIYVGLIYQKDTPENIIAKGYEELKVELARIQKERIDPIMKPNAKAIYPDGGIRFEITKYDANDNVYKILIRISYHAPQSNFQNKNKSIKEYHFIDILTQEIQNKIFENAKRKHGDDIDLEKFKYKEHHAKEVQIRFGKKVIECDNDFNSIKGQIEQIIGNVT